MPSCKEVASLIASEELADAGRSKRALVRIHLLMCRHCRRYAAQLRAIGAAAQDRWDTRHADRQALEKLESSILELYLGASDANIEDRRTHDPEPTQETDAH